MSGQPIAAKRDNTDGLQLTPLHVTRFCRVAQIVRQYTACIGTSVDLDGYDVSHGEMDGWING